ncbi:hypothetical protein BDV35DRAFT_365052 [Aspergillus flavus]|uniref:Uncharacterized protein n=1 Tax=Aspergillus flavus TaxID=5059 RepID=A0A5N6GK50_ASPFL|nr:hypothetical protein BDV35DRAFT_365052 [Aspergillus flavus]
MYMRNVYFSCIICDGWFSRVSYHLGGTTLFASLTFMFFFCFNSRYAHVGGFLFDSIDIRLLVFGKSRVNSSIIICISLLSFLHNLIPSPFFSRRSVFSVRVTLVNVITMTRLHLRKQQCYTRPQP